jgi:hypothetical protein
VFKRERGEAKNQENMATLTSTHTKREKEFSKNQDLAVPSISESITSSILKITFGSRSAVPEGCRFATVYVKKTGEKELEEGEKKRKRKTHPEPCHEHCSASSHSNFSWLAQANRTNICGRENEKVHSTALLKQGSNREGGSVHESFTIAQRIHSSQVPVSKTALDGSRSPSLGWGSTDAM